MFFEKIFNFHQLMCQMKQIKFITKTDENLNDSERPLFSSQIGGTQMLYCRIFCIVFTAGIPKRCTVWYR